MRKTALFAVASALIALVSEYGRRRPPMRVPLRWVRGVEPYPGVGYAACRLAAA